MMQYLYRNHSSNHVSHDIHIRNSNQYTDTTVKGKSLLVLKDTDTYNLRANEDKVGLSNYNIEEEYRHESKQQYRPSHVRNIVQKANVNSLNRMQTLEVTTRAAVTQPPYLEESDDCMSLLHSKKDSAVSHEFQPVEGVEMFVVSAYNDVRTDQPSVRILGLAPAEIISKTLQCMLFIKAPDGRYRKLTIPMVVSTKYAQLTHLAVYWKQVVGRCLAIRPYVDINTISLYNVEYVSVVKRDATCNNASNLLKIKQAGFYNSSNIFREHLHRGDDSVLPPDYKTLAMCLPTFYNLQATMAGPIVEFMEINRQLGFEKVFVYDVMDSSPEIHQVLEYYQSTGFVEIVKWKLPVPTYLKETYDFCQTFPNRLGCHLADR